MRALARFYFGGACTSPGGSVEGPSALVGKAVLVGHADFPPTTMAPIDAIDGAADVYIENTGTIIASRTSRFTLVAKCRSMTHRASACPGGQARRSSSDAGFWKDFGTERRQFWSGARPEQRLGRALSYRAAPGFSPSWRLPFSRSRTSACRRWSRSGRRS